MNRSEVPTGVVVLLALATPFVSFATSYTISGFLIDQGIHAKDGPNPVYALPPNDEKAAD